jgi:hypothetical protein
LLQSAHCRRCGWQAEHVAIGRTVIAMSSFVFNLFTIETAVHDADPSLTEVEIAAAYNSLIARDGLLPDPVPPLTKTESLIRDVIVRLANEQRQASA